MTFKAKAKVMLLGTFHFENPGLDIVKNQVTDITSKSSQTYLNELTSRISVRHGLTFETKSVRCGQCQK